MTQQLVIGSKSYDLATVPGIVLPSRDVQPSSKFHRLNVQHVQLFVKDAHKVGSKRVGDKWVDTYMHANHQLDGLFMAAGAEVLLNEPIKTVHPHVFTHRFVAKIILPTGKKAMADCHKTWDLRSLEEGGTRAAASFNRRKEQIKDYLASSQYAKWPKRLEKRKQGEDDDAFWARVDAFLKDEVESEMVESRVFGGEKAESGAKSRAIYDIFGLKMGETQEEFEQDIWVVTSLFDMEEALKIAAGHELGDQLAVLLALSQQASFGAMMGESVPGGQEAVKLLETLQNLHAIVQDGDSQKPLEVEMQPIDGEAIPADVEEELSTYPDEDGKLESGYAQGVAEQVGIVKQQAPHPATKEPKRPLTGQEKYQMTKDLTTLGYPGPKVVNDLLNAIWPGLSLQNADTLHRDIALWYARDVLDEDRANKARVEDKMSGAAMKAWKDGRKVLARQAYEKGVDLDKLPANNNPTP